MSERGRRLGAPADAPPPDGFDIDDAVRRLMSGAGLAPGESAGLERWSAEGAASGRRLPTIQLLALRPRLLGLAVLLGCRASPVAPSRGAQRRRRALCSGPRDRRRRLRRRRRGRPVLPTSARTWASSPALDGDARAIRTGPAIRDALRADLRRWAIVPAVAAVGLSFGAPSLGTAASFAFGLALGALVGAGRLRRWELRHGARILTDRRSSAGSGALYRRRAG